MKKIINTKEVEDYIMDQLNDSDRESFKKKLMEDRRLRESLGETQLMIEGIKRSASKSTKEEKLAKLKAHSLEIFLKNKSISDTGLAKEIPIRKRPKYLLRLAVACTFLIMLLATIAIIYTPKPMDNQSIFTTYYEPFDAPISNMRGEEQQIDLKVQAWTAYENEQYDEAVAMLEELIQDNTRKDLDQLKFYMGISYISTNSMDEAIGVLNEIANSNSILKTDAKWYLALAFLKTENTDQAKLLLKDLEEKNEYSIQAKRILKKLK